MIFIKKILLPFVLLLCLIKAASQQNTLDSLHKLYSLQKSDSAKLLSMWYIIDEYLNFRADSALFFAERSLALSKKIKSSKWESLSLKQIGDAYKILGNYPNALTYYLKRLEMDEKEEDPYKRAITLNSISNVYEYENDHEKSLEYLLKAEQIIDTNHIDSLKNLIYLNLCDVYEKKNNLSQAYLYAQKSLQSAVSLRDTVSVGISYNNIGNVFSKIGMNDSSLKYYRSAIPFLAATNTFHTICESYNGMAEVMEKKSNVDSAIYFAMLSATLAKKMQLNKYYLESSILLSRFYNNKKQFDSAYYYQSEAVYLKDSVFSEEKAKEVQLLTMNEDVRQKEIAEAAALAVEDRNHKLQLLAIGLLIPVLFFLSVLLSKRKIKRRVIEFTGILSLLMLFEYITLLIHPAVVTLTNDTPIYEIIIFICIAAILTPAHHRIQHWLTKKLTVQKNENIRIATKKIHQKKT